MLCLFTSFGNNFPNYTTLEFYEILPLCTANTVCAKPCNKIILFLHREGNKATIKKCAQTTYIEAFGRKEMQL
jgi:hypothetical protein